MSLIIVFGKGHALLLVHTRFRKPPIIRQISGQNAGELPMAICRDAGRIIGGNAAVLRSAFPVTAPDNVRAIAGQVLRHRPANFRSFSGMFAPRCRRITAVTVATIAGHSPAKFRAYD